MSVFIKILGIAFVAVVSFCLLKSTQPQIGNLVVVAAGTLILIFLSDSMQSLVTTLFNLGNKSQINAEVLSTLLKIVGIGYLTEYSVSLCEDCGCVSLGKKIELGGKIVILSTTLPIVTNIISLIEGLL